MRRWLASLVLLALASCGLPPEARKRIADCSALYAACVDSSGSMAEYRWCREGVDQRCLDGAGGGR